MNIRCTVYGSATVLTINNRISSVVMTLDKKRLSSTAFFFQAEDGIRDGTVTGVQTCALPIFKGGKKYEIKARGSREALLAEQSGRGVVLAAFSKTPFAVERFAENGHWDYRALSGDSTDHDPERSEERRVGKECRSRWSV